MKVIFNIFYALYERIFEGCSLTITHSARNLGFIFDEQLIFSNQISALSKSLSLAVKCQLHTLALATITS